MSRNANVSLSPRGINGAAADRDGCDGAEIYLGWAAWDVLGEIARHQPVPVPGQPIDQVGVDAQALSESDGPSDVSPALPMQVVIHRDSSLQRGRSVPASGAPSHDV